jgi:hypothetical protein
MHVVTRCDCRSLFFSGDKKTQRKTTKRYVTKCT